MSTPHKYIMLLKKISLFTWYLAYVVIKTLVFLLKTQTVQSAW